MLSITKINSAKNQAAKGSRAKGYLHYLGGPTNTTKQRGDFDDYARGKDGAAGPLPFWTGNGAALLGLDGVAETEQVERLAKGLHPATGAPLVKGAGDSHVMGLDMTFSAPKDVSAVFAGADQATRDAVVHCVQDAARIALGYAESASVSRHGHAGRIKQFVEGAISACYTHFSSRAGEPQLHVHGFFFNLGKRKGSNEWSALEHRVQFDRKMATGILFRVELASQLRSLGFVIEPAGPYFTIRGVDKSQRDALSSRSKQIAQYIKECGMLDVDGALAREVAALNTRSAKAEPSLPELMASFEKMADDIGMTPAAVAAMRCAPARGTLDDDPLALDHDELLDQLLEGASCATSQEALALICEKAMGRWTATECLEELGRFMSYPNVVQLGRTEHLTEIITSKATQDLEASITRAVADGAGDCAHQIDVGLIAQEFDKLEKELREQLGVEVSLAQQRDAACHIACETGRHALVEGWAGTGKTTLLRATRLAYQKAGFEVSGCCQSAAASLNLSREAGIPSRTIASLMLSLQKGRLRLGPKSILILDEAGMVGSREFGLLQAEALQAGAKLVCIGDSKQLQPIEAGGIFRALAERHGKAELSKIQRQRTNFEPILTWLLARGTLSKKCLATLRKVPEDARLGALESICSQAPNLRRAFGKWRERYDFEWMREAVELFAVGEAKAALNMLDERGRLKLISGHTAATIQLIDDWDADKTPIERKAIIAGTRAEVSELNRQARDRLVKRGLVLDGLGIEAEILHRDESVETKRFAPGDRVVFTKNDRNLGVSNGVAASVCEIVEAVSGPALVVELDDVNERGEKHIRVPASFGRFDHAYCLTNHKTQGRTFDSAFILANPGMADREWTYVATSRSRFASTVYANLGALVHLDIESHQEQKQAPSTREAAIDSLALRMRRSRAKGTTLDCQANADCDSKKQRWTSTHFIEAAACETLDNASLGSLDRFREVAARIGREAMRRLLFAPAPLPTLGEIEVRKRLSSRAFKNAPLPRDKEMPREH